MRESSSLPPSLNRRFPCHEEFSCGGSNASVETVRVAAKIARVDITEEKMPTRQRQPQQQQLVDRSTPFASVAGSRSRRCKRRRSALTVASLVAAVALIASASPTEAFANNNLPRLAPPSPVSLNAVHKRSGNREISSRTKAASIAASRGPKRKTTVAASPTTLESPAVVSSPASYPQRRRKSNVFEQFTPDYIASPFDVDLSPQQPQPPAKNGAANGNGHANGANGKASEGATGVTVDKAKIRQNNKVNKRLRTLLKDDTGEQENEMYPDHSPEAAEQLADLKSYSKLSEEARRKANLAVSANGDEGETDTEGERRRGRNGVVIKRGTAMKRTHSVENVDDGEVGRVTLASSSYATKRMGTSSRRRVRATVKETGSDSISTYIKSLGQHELLYKEDEVLLGRQVRMLTRLEKKRQELEEELLRPPTFAQWADATNHTVPSLKQQIRRSQRAKAALIEANLRLVITVARQATKKSPLRQSQGANSIQFQDACQQGIIGLTRATEKFDPELGFRFSTYAIWWIQKEVQRNVSEQSRTVRVPQGAIKKINDIRIQERILMNELGRRPNDDELAERVGMTVTKLNFYRQSAKEVSSLDKKVDARTGKGSMSTGGSDQGDGGNTMDVFVKDTEHPSPTELMNEQMLKEDIRRLVKTLSPREQAVIRLRFGLDDGKPLGLADISAKFGVERNLIKKIEARALLKLRQPSRSQVVRCYVSDHT
mmetsp:Transcript_20872/g.43996  ORF Transcript_20872/g.43996 Transcript_20872/m.43996 type:complete len:717 (+) Transcript_20872:137-2287(+)